MVACPASYKMYAVIDNLFENIVEFEGLSICLITEASHFKVMEYRCPLCGKKLDSKTDNQFRINLFTHLILGKVHQLSEEEALKIVDDLTLG
jgi:hypothetical protein